MIHLPEYKKRRSGGRYLRKGPAENHKTTILPISAVYWLFTLLYLELILHIEAFGAPNGSFVLALGFSAVFALGFALILSFLPKKAQFIASCVITAVLIVFYGSQMVYNFVFGTLYSVAQMAMGGDAVTSFWRETLLAMTDHIFWILALLVPIVPLIALKKHFTPTNMVWRAVILAAAVALQLICGACVGIGGTGYFSNHYFYHSSSATTDQTTSRFGLLTAFRLDLLGAGDAETSQFAYYVPEATEAPTQTADPEQPQETASPEETTPTETEPEPEPEYNIINIDFDKLNELTTDEAIEAINNYCASLSGSTKNKYTGMLRDYNLIVLCGESFSSAAIHPEVTPTLYKMATEGIIFNNFYNSFPNNTIDGEYALSMGLYPDTSRNKNESSFLASRFCYLPYCLGNAFQEQLGAQGYGYHNNNRDYYSRGASHSNMGYKMKFSGSGMNFTSSAWPKSDLEMMEQSVDDYITQEQFVAYYMTFSGHMKYNVNVNGMAAKNYDAVSHLDLSETAKCYLACNVELDKAIEYLMQRLEAEGIADKTAIVLVGDHYPYGLTDEEYSELIGYTVDDFSKYKSSLLFWVGGLEETIVVEDYCCNVDILPTILNLWGFEYDSRMLAGTDVFSDGPHMAVLIDKSFLTDKVWLNANTGEVRYLAEENQLPENYVENLIRTVETKFSISADILNKSYYKFVFETGSDAIDSELRSTSE